MANPVPYQQLFDIDGLNTAIQECEGTADQFSAAVTEDFKRINTSVQAIRKSIEALNASMGSRTIKLVDESSQEAIVAYAKQVVDLTKQVRDQQTAITNLNEVINANKVAVSDAKVAAANFVTEQQNLKAQQEATKLSIVQQTLSLEQQKQALTDSKLATQQAVQGQQQNKTAISASNLANQQYISTIKQNQAAQAALNTQVAQNRLAISNLALANKQAAQAQTAATGSYNEATARLKALGAEIKSMPGEFEQSTKAGKALVAEYNQLNKQLKDFDTQMGNNQRRVGTYADAFKGVGSQLKALALSYISVMAILATGEKVVKNNEEISDSLVLVRQKAQMTKEEAAALLETLKKIDTRTSLKGLVDIAGIGAKRGVDKNGLAIFAENLDKVNLAMNGAIQGGAEGVAAALAKLNTLYGETEKLGIAEALKQTGGALVELGQHGIVTSENLTDFATRTASVAKIFQLTLPQVLAYGAAFQETGVEAEKSGTAFNKLLILLAARRDKYFAIAQLGDAKLTLKSFTELINTDANAALQKFFAGLTSGGASATQMADRLKELDVRQGDVAKSILGLANAMPMLQEQMSRSKKGFEDANLVLDQAADKNDTLGASVDKLGNSLVKLTTSGNVAGWLKDITDGLTAMVNKLRQLTEARGFKEFIVNLGGRVFSSETREAIKEQADQEQIKNDPQYRQSQKSEAIQTALGEFTATKRTDGQAIDQQYRLQYIKDQEQQANQWKEAFKNKPASAVLKQKAEEAVGVYNALVDSYNKMYNTIKKKTNPDGPETPDKDLNSIEELRQRITEVSKLPGSADKSSEVYARLLELKKRLHDLQPDLKKAKDGFEILEERIKKAMLALQDGIIRDYAKHQGKESANTKQLAADYQNLYEKLLKLQKLRDDAVDNVSRDQQIAHYGVLYPQNARPQSLPDLTVDPTKRGSKSTLGNELQVSQDNIDVNTGEKDLDAVVAKYAKANTKIANLFKQRNLSKLEYDSELLANETSQANEEYFIQANILNKQLEIAKITYGEDSKQYGVILAQKAKLDEAYAEKSLKLAVETEEKKRELMKAVLEPLTKNADVVSASTDNPGLGKLLTDTSSSLVNGMGKPEEFKEIAQFAIDATQTYTDFAINASKQRQQMLEQEMTYEIQGAGSNARAKQKIEQEYTAKVKAEKTKQAKLQKAASAVEVILNTAIAVSSALTAGPVSGEALAIVVAALGAIELGIVLAQPIPQFEKGRENGPATFAEVNENGPEALIKNGKVRFANKGQRGYTYLQKDEKVLRADDTAAFISSQIHNAEYVSRSKATYDSWVATQSGGGGLDYEKMAVAVSGAVSKLPLEQNVWDERGYAHYRRTQNAKIKSVRDRNRM